MGSDHAQEGLGTRPKPRRQRGERYWFVFGGLALFLVGVAIGYAVPQTIEKLVMEVASTVVEPSATEEYAVGAKPVPKPRRAGLDRGESGGASSSGPEFRIKGYGSAEFGMTEEEVRKAIAADFGIGDQAIRRFRNEAQKTTVLRVVTRGVNPRIAEHVTILAYILGYQSSELIRVNLVWGTDITPGLSPADFNTKAQLLLRTLLSRNFDQNKVRLGGRFPDGTNLLFRGVDTAGHAVLLRTRELSLDKGEAADTDRGGQGPANAYRLLLSYIKDPSDVDIYQGEELGAEGTGARALPIK